ncbi:adenylyltransferase/cytidyltransferase family protein [Corynebacterium suedekumii]|nr:adenylyltransferase/cytidyltransferase family protein [Corynebacterium suedekumii]
MLHVGHINILTAARERCSHLVVGVATDESLERMKRPVTGGSPRRENEAGGGAPFRRRGCRGH